MRDVRREGSPGLHVVATVAANMRDADWSEWRAIVPGVRHEHVATACAQFPETLWAWRLDGLPVYVMGFMPDAHGPGRWSCFGFGTSCWPFVARTVTKDIRRDIIPAASAAGMRCAETAVPPERDDVIRWLRALGMQVVEPAPGDGQRPGLILLRREV